MQPVAGLGALLAVVVPGNSQQAFLSGFAGVLNGVGSVGVAHRREQCCCTRFGRIVLQVGIQHREQLGQVTAAQLGQSLVADYRLIRRQLFHRTKSAQLAVQFIHGIYHLKGTVLLVGTHDDGRNHWLRRVLMLIQKVPPSFQN